MVKFAHHVSGAAHFSLDGKMNTVVRRAAVPLDQVNGRLFSVMFQGLQSFEKVDPIAHSKKGRSEFTLSLTVTRLPAVKVQAHLQRQDRLPWGTLRPLPCRIGSECATAHNSRARFFGLR